MATHIGRRLLTTSTIRHRGSKRRRRIGRIHSLAIDLPKRTDCPMPYCPFGGFFRLGTRVVFCRGGAHDLPGRRFLHSECARGNVWSRRKDSVRIAGRTWPTPPGPGTPYLLLTASPIGKNQIGRGRPPDISYKGESMNRRMAMYAGTIALALMARHAGLQSGLNRIRRPPDSTMGKGATSTPKESPSFDKKTDLTGGKQGIPEEYADTPRSTGELVEMKTVNISMPPSMAPTERDRQNPAGDER